MDTPFHISMDSQGVYRSICLEFFLKPVYPTTLLRKSFKFMVLRLLEDTFVSQKVTFVHFYWYPKADGNYSFHLNNVFWKSILPQQKGGRIMELTKCPKLNLGRYWSQILINSTIFAAFAFLHSVSFCHNLDSDMLNCKGSLT